MPGYSILWLGTRYGPSVTCQMKEKTWVDRGPCKQRHRPDVSAGETGVIAAAGRQWLHVARLLCDCLALGLRRRTHGEGAETERATPEAAGDTAIHDDDGRLDRAAKRQRVSKPARAGNHQAAQPCQGSTGEPAKLRQSGDADGICCSSHRLPAWHHSLAQLRACQRAWHALLDKVRTAEPREGRVDAAHDTSRLELELLNALGRASDLNTQAVTVFGVDENVTKIAVEENSLLVSLQQAVAKEATGCGAKLTDQLQGLAIAAVHALSRAAALLALCVGPTHVLREANAFGSCFGRLPWSIASAIVAASDEVAQSRIC